MNTFFKTLTFSLLILGVQCTEASEEGLDLNEMLIHLNHLKEKFNERASVQHAREITMESTTKSNEPEIKPKDQSETKQTNEKLKKLTISR